MVEGGGGPFVYAQYVPPLPSSGHHGLARHCFGRGGPLATLGIMQRELQGTWWGEGAAQLRRGHQTSTISNREEVFGKKEVKLEESLRRRRWLGGSESGWSCGLVGLSPPSLVGSYLEK